MADPRSSATRRAFLSYSHLRELTEWPALMLEDYQGIQQDFNFTADELDDIDIRVTENEADIIVLQQEVIDIKLRLDALEYLVFNIVNTTVDLIVDEFSMVICRNAIPINITLKLIPVTGDEIHVKRTDGQINIIGVVDGVADPVLNLKNWNAHYVFNGIDWSSL